MTEQFKSAIEKKHFDAISEINPAYTTELLYKDAASACALITEQEMKGFAQWAMTNFFYIGTDRYRAMTDSVHWIESEVVKNFTADELLSLYLDYLSSLEKEGKE